MKNTKELLELAMKSLPSDFALRDVRLHVARAINELNKIETKKEKRDKQGTVQERWKLDLETGMLAAPPIGPVQRINALAKIEELIKAEEQKIKALNSKNKPGDVLFD